MACSESPYTTSFDASRLHESQRTAVQDAADQWCSETKGVCCPKLSDHGENVIELVTMLKNGNTEFHAGVSHITLQVKFAENLDLLGRIARHEFGHACRAQNVGELKQGHLPKDHVMAHVDEEQPTYLTTEDLKYVGVTVEDSLPKQM
jgi:hypothetical protein